MTHHQSQKASTSLLISFIITDYRRDGGEAKQDEEEILKGNLKNGLNGLSSLPSTSPHVSASL